MPPPPRTLDGPDVRGLYASDRTAIYLLTQDSDDPRSLPPELEREIVELAVREYPEMAATLPRVAHRIRVW
jgi:hypothetical protein